ncbi:lipopolysaccharide biosynthesis protein [Acinetobacter baumannii]|uniref:lipopolysaccharide biosynthesis protein n=1 Tax=Acinetobacter baumannii TaxID=470 RepID=UPI00387DCC30
MRIFIKLMSSGILVQALMLLSTLVFSRIYLVDDFGELAFYASFGSIMAIIGGLRFDYILLKESIWNKVGAYFLSNISSFFSNLIIFLIFFIIQYFFHLLNYNLFILFLFGFGFSIFNNLTQFFVAQKKYNYFITLRFIQVITVFVIAALAYVSSYELKGLLWAYGGSQFLLGLMGFVFVLKNESVEINLVSLHKFYKENISEAAKNSLISFMQYSTPLIPVFVGGMFYDKKIIGAYFVFSQMISAPLNVIRRNLLIYFNGEFSSKEKFYNAFYKVFSLTRFVLFLSILSVVLLITYFFKDELTILVLGSQWSPYAYLLLPLVFYFIFDSLLQPFTTLLPLWNKVNISLLYEGCRFILLVIVLPVLIHIFKFDFVIFLTIYIFIMLCVYLMIFYKIFSLPSSLGEKLEASNEN